MKIFTLLLVATILTFSGCGEDPASREPQEKTEVNAEAEWYVGGTLHAATVSTWQNATYDNKLATCADYVAAVTGEVSEEKATSLKNCIDSSIGALADNPNQEVSELASLCIISLGY